MENRGKLFVISGPSGAGKSTVIARLLKRLDKTYFSISATTREPRRGERDGFDYHFVKKEQFTTMIEKDLLLEWAQYVNNYYGTPAEPVDEKLAEGFDVILDIETQGAAQVMARRPDTVGMFLFPGSFSELEDRLRARGSDSEEKIQKRLVQARRECERVGMYSYVIINDRVETAAEEAASIIIAEKCRTANRMHYFI